MKKISYVGAGGTIVQKSASVGKKVAYTLEEVIKQFPGLNEKLQSMAQLYYNLDVQEPIDSSDANHADWAEIANIAFRELYTNEMDAVVIAHGTDSMSFSTAALSFMVLNPNKPIIFTGSQKTVGQPDNDIPSNLLSATRAAIEDGLRGVYLVFNNRLIRGTRVRKTHSTNNDAFRGLGFGEVGYVSEDSFHYVIDERRKPIKGLPTLDTRVGGTVFIVNIAPSTSPNVLDGVLKQVDGLIIGAYGSGSFPINKKEYSLLPIIANWAKSKPIVVVSQCESGEVNMDLYETGKRVKDLGVIPGYDVGFEAAYAKLMIALGRTKDLDLIKEFMHTPVAGEITIR